MSNYFRILGLICDTTFSWYLVGVSCWFNSWVLWVVSEIGQWLLIGFYVEDKLLNLDVGTYRVFTK